MPDLPHHLFDAAPGGVVPAADLVRAGLSHGRLVELALAGAIHRLAHGTYARPEGHPLQHLALALVYLDQRTPANHMRPALTGVTALALRGLEHLPIDVKPDVLVDTRSRARTYTQKFTIIRGGDPSQPLSIAQRLCVTPYSRSLVDAAADDTVTDPMLRSTIDVLRNRGMASVPQLVREWRSTRAGGAARLEAMLATGDLDMESEGERDFYRAVFDPHPPVPDCQVVLVGKRRVDFVFLSAALVIEYHGRASHADRVDEDALRIFELERLGYRVIVVTVSMLRDPGRLAAMIHGIRRDREQRISRGELPLPPLPPQPERLTPLRTLHPWQPRAAV